MADLCMGNSVVTCFYNRGMTWCQLFFFLPGLTAGLLASPSAHLFFFLAVLLLLLTCKIKYHRLVLLHSDHTISLHSDLKHLILMRRST